MTISVRTESIAPCSLSELQFEFAEAILDPDRPVPSGLTGPDGKPSTKRFAVYRNNVVAGLCKTLKAAFPAVHRIVGEEFFTTMARVYLSREPPNSPIMIHYGGEFADFVGAFEPAAELSYLRDVALLERAWVEAYHAAEAAPADPATLGGIGPNELPHMSLVLHPSVRVVRSSFPVVTIWQMNIDGGVPVAIDMNNGGEDALVTRPAAEVEVRVLNAGAASFIDALAAGASVADAAQFAFDDDPQFDLADTLRGTLAAQAIVGWNLGDDSHDLITSRSA